MFPYTWFKSIYLYGVHVLYYRCSVRVITSDYGGMGKSLCVTKLEKKLQQKLTEPTDYPLCITIPIHGPGVDLDVVMKYLQHHLIHVVDPPPQIFHFDIPPSVSS